MGVSQNKRGTGSSRPSSGVVFAYAIHTDFPRVCHISLIRDRVTSIYSHVALLIITYNSRSLCRSGATELIWSSAVSCYKYI